MEDELRLNRVQTRSHWTCEAVLKEMEGTKAIERMHSLNEHENWIVHQSSNFDWIPYRVNQVRVIRKKQTYAMGQVWGRLTRLLGRVGLRYGN